VSEKERKSDATHMKEACRAHEWGGQMYESVAVCVRMLMCV